MSGFVSAAAIIIVASQLKDLLGIPIESSSVFYDNVYDVFSNIGKSHWLTSIIGISALIPLVGFKYLHFCKLWPCTNNEKPPPKWFPIQLLVVIIFIVISILTDLEGSGVRVVGQIPAGFPTPAFPLQSVS